MGSLHTRLYGGDGFHRVFWSPADVEEIIRRYGGRAQATPYAPRTIMRAVEAADVGSSSNNATYNFVASTSSIDRMGDISHNRAGTSGSSGATRSSFGAITKTNCQWAAQRKRACKVIG
jgi:hypothetical protein